jgi:nicotinamidase-related amidase
VIQKRNFDATKENDWKCVVPRSQNDIVVAGCEGHVCVLQTVIGLLNEGRRVRVVRDAVGSRTDENKEAGLQRAARFGADIVTTEMVLFEWIKGCDHGHFRNILDLVK